MSDTLPEQRDDDSLEYPYDGPVDIQAEFCDPYNRNYYRLLASLTRFGRRILNREAFERNIELIEKLPSITRLCEDSTLPEALSSLLHIRYGITQATTQRVL